MQLLRHADVLELGPGGVQAPFLCLVRGSHACHRLLCFGELGSVIGGVPRPPGRGVLQHRCQRLVRLFALLTESGKESLGSRRAV